MITKTIYGYSEEDDKIMGYFKRRKSKTYNDGTRMIIPGLGILTANIQNSDKLRIKPNKSLNNVFPPPTPTPSNTPSPSSTPANTPTPTPTPSSTPIKYYINFYAASESSFHDLIFLYKSTNSGLTWEPFYWISPGYDGAYSGVGLGFFNSGSTLWFGFKYNNTDVQYGAEFYSGDFNSLCGLSEPFKINSFTADTSIYLNLAANDNAYITC